MNMTHQTMRDKARELSANLMPHTTSCHNTYVLEDAMNWAFEEAARQCERNAQASLQGKSDECSYYVTANNCAYSIRQMKKETL